MGDLWVEYKFLPDGKIPVRADVHPEHLLSALQLDWLNEQAGYGRNCKVIIGCKEGGVLMTSVLDWSTPISPEGFRKRVIDRKRLAHTIMCEVLHVP